ncbi:MAG: DUF1971 domain-containing protein [Acidimicrobiia bacterium]|nr:DUF1971 domain-containing protein [Acidimicrobiia bacterium]
MASALRCGHGGWLVLAGGRGSGAVRRHQARWWPRRPARSRRWGRRPGEAVPANRGWASRGVLDYNGAVTGRPSIPSGATLRRTTDELTAETVPAGLLRGHRVAEGVWGLLRVRAGSVRFVLEDGPSEGVLLAAGDEQVIEPGLPHHVEPAPDARFVVEFYR